MSLTPDGLLAGPRGRRLCLEILLLSTEDPEVQDAAWAVSWAAHALAENPGTVLTFGDGAASFTEPDVSPADAAAALSRVAIPDLTEAVLDETLAIAVDRAAYWQPPHGEDVLAATAELRPVLAPVAAAIVDSPHTGWWGSPVARDAQARVFWEDERASTDAPERIVARWRESQVAEERRFAQESRDSRLSGSWWSTPAVGLARSTRRRGAAGPVGLRLVEDSFGWTSARVQPLTAPAGEVIEIDGPEAWAALCRRHPFPLTASRRTVWGWTTGREGAWVQPDWAEVAREASGVHLSVAGYLATAGRVIDLGDLGATLVAGWGPDETFWFSDPGSTGPEQRWVVDGAGGARRWRRD
ncbi:MAG: hypothetical protein PIR02_19980 [Microbacterium enclense]